MVYTSLTPDPSNPFLLAQEGKTGRQLYEEFGHNPTLLFEILFALYSQRMLRYLYGMIGNYEGVVDDLLQEVFMRVYRNMHKLPEYDYPDRWIYKITHNVAISWFRKNPYQRMPVPLDPEADWLASNDISVEEAVTRRESDAEFESALWQLIPEHRGVIILKRQGKSSAEIGEIMLTKKGSKRSEGAVRALLHRAMIALRRLLDPRR